MKTMISQTGNKQGFTFIEIMVTLVVFTTGILAVFQSYHISLDRMNHITNRLYVNVYLDEHLQSIERNLRVYQTLPYELDRTDALNLGAKTLPYTRNLSIAQVEHFNDIFKIELTYAWQENGKTISLTRSTYVADFELEDQ